MDNSDKSAQSGAFIALGCVFLCKKVTNIIFFSKSVILIVLLDRFYQNYPLTH
ncbi:hypothetical protein HNR74_003882 [Flammeovirga kamogawensis]|nr:hypothetical protein [Flammeovirga kamogawensis]